ncbi:hypothetical protein ACWDA3_00335 [Nonomuraea rubra]
MLFIELLVPQGVFGEQERRDLARRLTGRRLLAAADDGDTSAADPGVIDLLDSLTHVVVREEEVWMAGGELLDPSGGARYMVNVVAGMWGKEMSDHLVSRIAAELAEAEGDPQPRRHQCDQCPGGRLRAARESLPFGRHAPAHRGRQDRRAVAGP